MKNILLQIDENLHTALKMEATRQKTTIKDFLTELIRSAVEKGGKKE